MNTVAIVQARMGSSRLPGKVLLHLAGKPELWHVLNRLSYCSRLDSIVVATTTKEEDNQIEDFCNDSGLSCFRGSEEDLLDRYYQTAKKFDADPIVRITGDCPVIDPVIVDEVIDGFLNGEYDVYGLGGEFPDGLDCTVYSFSAIENAWQYATLHSEREHVGPYLNKHPEKYRLGEYKIFKGLNHHRWTLDEEEDYRFLKEIFNRLYKPDNLFHTQDILDLLEREPELMEINRGIIRNEGYLKSLVEDQEFLQKQT